MARVSQEDIIRINDVYYKCRTYAQTARETGFSPATVKKYVIDGYAPAGSTEQKRFSGELPEFSTKPFMREDWGNLCVYTEEEEKELSELWKELKI